MEIYIEDIPRECIEDCSGPGSADTAVAYWREQLDFTVPADKARECLLEYGAWEADDLAEWDDIRLAETILWLACGDFAEWDGTADSHCGSDIFTLGI